VVPERASATTSATSLATASSAAMLRWLIRAPSLAHPSSPVSDFAATDFPLPI
jgi:hypothetical protein